MLRLPPLSTLRPTSLAEATAALGSAPPPRILGGGTDLVPSLKLGLGGAAALQLLSVEGLGLAGIEQRDGAWTLGAATPLWDLIRWKPAGALGAISEAARSIAAPPIQSRATLGGNLCLDTRCFHYNQSTFWRSSRPVCFKAGGDVCHVAPGGNRCFACHQADLPPVLIALGASADIRGARGPRTVPVEALYTGDGRAPLSLAPDELLAGVSVPTPPKGAGAGWEKIRMRKGLDFAVASAAAYVELGADGKCTAARVVLGALGSGPIRVTEAEEALVGSSALDETLLEKVGAAARAAARPMKNVDLTPAYRKKVAGVAAKRAVEKAWATAKG
ncbi:MAG: hypothetical protein HGA98_02985 [Deltaproteobacteria bacterium]|nr:hypothetical protein [Deltaproteobacteria bacterium]